jgi:hypothetical protein
MLKNVHVILKQRLWFQYDRAPVHYEADIRQLLNPAYPGRWIGVHGLLGIRM